MNDPTPILQEIDQLYMLIADCEKVIFKNKEEIGKLEPVSYTHLTDCDVRLYKENFFEVFKLSFRKSDKGWTVSCTDNVYLDTGEVIKLSTKELSHGDTISVKYQSSNKEIFRIDFLFDFDNEKKNYNRKIDISSADTISIGSSMLSLIHI